VLPSKEDNLSQELLSYPVGCGQNRITDIVQLNQARSQHILTFSLVIETVNVKDPVVQSTKHIAQQIFQKASRPAVLWIRIPVFRICYLPFKIPNVHCYIISHIFDPLRPTTLSPVAAPQLLLIGGTSIVDQPP
jgi:hypothetical protein